MSITLTPCRRTGSSRVFRAMAALNFAEQIANRDHTSEEELEFLRRAGYSDHEIAEVFSRATIELLGGYYERQRHAA